MQEHWTEIITPKHHLFSLKLGELWRYRDLVMLFVRRDFLAAHKQTVLGWLWHVIAPFINILLYTLVFNTIARLSTEGVPSVLFQAVSYMVWAYFASSLSAASGVLINNSSLFAKVYFPRISVVLSGVLSGMLRLLIQLALILPIWAYYYYKGTAPVPTYYLLLFPIVLVLMSIVAMGLGYFIAAITAKYRDFNYLLGYGIAALMYSSAVMYPLSQVPDAFRDYATYNPLVPLMEATRHAFFGTGSWDWASLGIIGVVSIVIFSTGLMVFHQAERTFIDSV